MSRHTTKSEKDFYTDLGRNLSLARKAAGMSQADAAEHAGVTFQQLQKWEKGVNRIPVRELATLSAHIGAPLAELLGIDQLKPADSPLRRLLGRMPDKEFMDVVKAWSTINDPRMKAAVVKFINALAAID